MKTILPVSKVCLNLRIDVTVSDWCSARRHIRTQKDLAVFRSYKKFKVTFPRFWIIYWLVETIKLAK